MFGVPYIPIESLPQQERIRLVETVLGLAGFERSATSEASHRLEEPIIDDPRPTSVGYDRREGNATLNRTTSSI